MYQGVLGEVRLLGKYFSTLYTFILSTVYQGVALKLTFSYKTFVTLLTLKLVVFVLDGAAGLEVILAITPASPHT